MTTVEQARQVVLDWVWGLSEEEVSRQEEEELERRLDALVVAAASEGIVAAAEIQAEWIKARAQVGPPSGEPGS